MGERCASWLAGRVCPDDLCQHASTQTLCGGWLESIEDDHYDEDDGYWEASDG